MTQDVYVDLLFLINFSMDYLCLYICAKVLHRRLRLSKMLISSAIGGAYSVISVFLPFSAPVSLIFDAVFCVIICIIAFAEKGRGFSSVLVYGFLFVGISMMTGGVMTAIFNFLNRLDLPLDGIDGDGISTYLFAIVAAAAGIISLRSGELISRRSSVRECKITLTVCGNTVTLPAMSDSGNLLKDPLSGKSVVLIDKNELSKLTDISVFEAFLRGEAPHPQNGLKGLRIIPINTAAGRSALCAAIPDRLSVEITSKKKQTLTLDLNSLIAPSDIGQSAEGYRAIVPSEILKI